MPLNDTALRNEIMNGAAYTDARTNRWDNVIADLLNADNPAILIDRAWISPAELADAIVYGEYSAGGTGANIARQYIDMLMVLPKINILPNSRQRTAILAIFTATGAGTTRSNLQAISQRIGNRIEQLMYNPLTDGDRLFVSVDDVSRVLNG